MKFKRIKAMYLIPGDVLAGGLKITRVEEGPRNAARKVYGNLTPTGPVVVRQFEALELVAVVEDFNDE